jgi:hypothetical protein
MPEKSFYDIHCHALNLSHPNLTAFLERVNVNLLLTAAGFWGPFIEFFQKKKIERMKNLLAVMENDTANYFLLLEYYLRSMDIVNGNTIDVGGIKYNKIILTPLMMDFGYKHTRSGTFYNIPPQKPIVEQVLDVFNGIAKYSKYEMFIKEDGEVAFKDAKKDEKLFEIYPFLGINTENYSLSKISKMLDKYFKDYKADRNELYANMGTFTGDIEKLGCNNFAGIKVYPPLGFDPWPEDAEEKKKVEALYGYCCEKKIPVTTHCSEGGFRTADKACDFTDPLRWLDVLKKYPDLKINFAHFGRQDKALWIIPQQRWQQQILKLVADYPNVYTDFSYRGCEEKYYDELRELLDKEAPQIRSRVLFGSDFMINLMDIDSYNEYLSFFIKSQSLTTDEKDLFCSANPSKFLFCN